MTSKNILLFGTLLFLLLVTSCVVYFIDRYNPQIQTVQYISPGTIAPDNNVSPLVEEHFTQDITIDTIPIIKNKTTLEKPTLQHKAPNTHNTMSKNLTLKSDHAKNVPQQIKERQKKPIFKTSKKKSLKNLPKKKIVIEPVLLTKTLTSSKSGNLYRWDKTFLQDIVKKAKINKSLFVVLRSSHITPAKRTYLQHIKSFLLKNGLHASQIKVEVDRHKKEHQIVFSDIQKNKIELSLLERIY